MRVYFENQNQNKNVHIKFWMYVYNKKDSFLSWQTFSISNKLNMKQMVEISIKDIHPKYYKHSNRFVLLLFLGQLQKCFLIMLCTFWGCFLYISMDKTSTKLQFLYIISICSKKSIYKVRKLSILAYKEYFLRSK